MHQGVTFVPVGNQLINAALIATIELGERAHLIAFTGDSGLGTQTIPATSDEGRALTAWARSYKEASGLLAGVT